MEADRMSRIYEDRYGLYIKNGGYIARPVPTEYTRHDRVNEDSEYCAGDSVKARHIGGTCQHKVGEGDHVEYWSSHGCYLEFIDDDPRPKNSEECWEPAGGY